MARCCGGATCTCAIIAGEGVVISGIGSSSDPYVVSTPPFSATDMDEWPTYVYGNSYGVLSAAYFTAGNHYTEQVAEDLNGGAVTSYAVAGKRILDVVSSMENQSPYPNLVTAAVAGGLWPGVSNRSGLVVLDSIMNDIGHYPSMAVSPVVPAVLSTVNTKYLDSMTLAYRHTLALATSETRIEQTARTATSGTWTQDSASTYASGGSVSWTTQAGAYNEFSITPPQSGPMRGIVFVHGFIIDSSVGTMAQQTISVDGVVQLTRTPTAWEQYVGPGGGQVNVGPDCFAVTIPVDGAAHPLRLAHSGAGGQFMYNNFISIPSIDPDPIAVMGGEHTIAYTGWTSTQRSIFHGNAKAVIPKVQAVVAEFPHALYAPSTITADGLYSADGLHPNDRGMAQRANDLKTKMVDAIHARLESRRLSNLPDSDFSII